MKKTTRFLKSVVETARSSDPRLPWARQTRTPRASTGRNVKRRA
ncbi:hypothetical protein [Antarcticimicrobium luteum]|nr:hypothetical protein [Antarcticimicrobium luteum]